MGPRSGEFFLKNWFCPVSTQAKVKKFANQSSEFSKVRNCAMKLKDFGEVIALKGRFFAIVIFPPALI